MGRNGASIGVRPSLAAVSSAAAATSRHELRPAHPLLRTNFPLTEQLPSRPLPQVMPGFSAHRTAALVAALLVAAVAPCPAAALTASELALYKQLAGGLATLSDVVVNNKTPPAALVGNTTGGPTVATAAAAKATPAAAAAAAATPAGASPAAVAKALGTILAAASLDAAAAGTLGIPRKFKWVHFALCCAAWVPTASLLLLAPSRSVHERQQLLHCVGRLACPPASRSCVPSSPSPPLQLPGWLQAHCALPPAQRQPGDQGHLHLCARLQARPRELVLQERQVPQMHG